jgi:hypothetical protein
MFRARPRTGSSQNPELHNTARLWRDQGKREGLPKASTPAI